MDEGGPKRLEERIRGLARLARDEGIESLTVHPDGTITMHLGAAPNGAPPAPADIAKLREADAARRERLRYAHAGGA